MAVTGKFQNLAADGSTDWLSFIGPVLVHGVGTFGGGTAQIQLKDPAGAAMNVPNASFTAAFSHLIDIPPGVLSEVRVNLTGATAPNFNAWVQGDDY